MGSLWLEAEEPQMLYFCQYPLHKTLHVVLDWFGGTVPGIPLPPSVKWEYKDLWLLSLISGLKIFNTHSEFLSCSPWVPKGSIGRTIFHYIFFLSQPNVLSYALNNIVLHLWTCSTSAWEIRGRKWDWVPDRTAHVCAYALNRENASWSKWRASTGYVQ